MTIIDIDETTDIGKDILRKLVENPKAGRVREFKIPYDERGVPVGYSLDEVFVEMDKKLSEVYGVDFVKVSRMIKSGKLTDEDLTDELLCSPEFEYKPYPGFRLKSIPRDFKPNTHLLAALSE